MTPKPRIPFSQEQKDAVVRRMAEGETITGIALDMGFTYPRLRNAIAYYNLAPLALGQRRTASHRRSPKAVVQIERRRIQPPNALPGIPLARLMAGR